MKLTVFLIFLLTSFTCIAQSEQATNNNTKEKINGHFWDVQKYKLEIFVNIDNKSISGTNKIFYRVMDSLKEMKIDLQAPMKISEVTQNGAILKFKKIGNYYLIPLEKQQTLNTIDSISVQFYGKPKETDYAPWKSGFTWSTDINGFDFIGTTCQADGASLWWPCKDQLYDEPDKGIETFYTVPSHLLAVGNGRLIDTNFDKTSKTKTYHWKTTNPINNYGVQLSIGNYVKYNNQYKGETGILDCEYYVLKQHISRAKTQFTQVKKMLEAFEFWLGPYPFYEDSYKIVEVPYLGMEHQSAIGYGNNFQNGYLGTDLSETGWGLKFDFIIIHESGHEWFGNNITNKDKADMWIHEAFTNYSEALYLEYYFGKKAANEYLIGIRKNIKNNFPIIGSYKASNRDTDMYYKGANMLQTIRHVIANDETWRLLLRGLNKTFYHKTVSTEELENYISSFTNIDFSTVFNQYLRTSQIPTFEYKLSEKEIQYRYHNCLEDFQMSQYAFLNGKKIKLTPSTNWQKTKFQHKIYEFKINPNYYMNIKKYE
jgi:aminopeptidase N